MASPMAWAEAAQAVTGAPIGPLKPYLMEIQPAARLARKLGTVNGDSRRGPFSLMMLTASAITGEPPTPEPMMVPVTACFSGVSAIQPDCASASAAAPNPYWMNRSIFLMSLGSITAVGSKPLGCSLPGTSPAILQAKAVVSKRVLVTMPLRPAISACQFASTPTPSGETAPMPVTTIGSVSVIKIPFRLWLSAAAS